MSTSLHLTCQHLLHPAFCTSWQHVPRESEVSRLDISRSTSSWYVKIWTFAHNSSFIRHLSFVICRFLRYYGLDFVHFNEWNSALNVKSMADRRFLFFFHGLGTCCQPFIYQRILACSLHTLSTLALCTPAPRTLVALTLALVFLHSCLRPDRRRFQAQIVHTD